MASQFPIGRKDERVTLAPSCEHQTVAPIAYGTVGTCLYLLVTKVII